MNKFKITIALALVLTIGLSAGVYADSLAKKISAYQNAGIKVKVDGTTLDLSDSTGSLDPIVYNGHSYVPAKAIAEALGGVVTWDAATTSVVITTGIPVKDEKLPTEDQSTPEVIKPKPTQAPVEKPAPTEKPQKNSSDEGILKLTTIIATTAKMREQAVQLIKIYAEAIETSNTTKFDTYIDTYVADSRENSPINIKRSFRKAAFSEAVKGIVAANNSTDIADFVKTIKAVTLAEVETSNVSEKSKYSQTLSFKYYPKNWNTGVFVYFEFQPDQYDSDNFILSNVDVH